MSSAPLRVALTLLASGACAGCYGRNHTLHEGTYAFVPGEIISDQCGIYSGSPVLWSGAMLISGDLVRIQMDDRLYGIQAVGYYLASEERFSLDGSAGNVTAQANGAECLVTLVQAHFESTTDSTTSFHGTTGIMFSTRQSGCSCQLWLRFTANLQ